VSASSCTVYAAGTIGSFNQIGVTIAIMAFFALLVTLGVKDSANVATAFFAFHLITLTNYIEEAGPFETQKFKGIKKNICF